MIPIADPDIGRKERGLVNKALKEGWVSSKGPYVEKFEEEFSKLHRGYYAVACSSGTSALHLALLAIGIKPGDEVIVPSFTFFSTVSAVAYCGATPVFADIREDTWCLDLKDVEKKITEKTKVVIPVHIYGNPCQMDFKMHIPSRSNGIYIIEDCAEALGSFYTDEPVGTLGNIGIFSFFANKAITTGEGGMCITRSRVLDERLRAYRDYGRIPGSGDYNHSFMGYNYRMGSLQAALGLAQISRLHSFLDKRDLIAEIYTNELYIHPRIILPKITPGAEPVCWTYTVRVKDIDISWLRRKLKDKGVDSRPGFPPVHKMDVIGSTQDLPVTDIISRETISLPCYTKMDKDQVLYVCDTLKEILNG